jgi:hypothetical protein
MSDLQETLGQVEWNEWFADDIKSVLEFLRVHEDTDENEH